LRLTLISLQFFFPGRGGIGAFLRQALISLHFERCRPAVYGAFSRLTLISLQFFFPGRGGIGAFSRLALISLHFERCRPAVYGAFSRQALISLQLSRLAQSEIGAFLRLTLISLQFEHCRSAVYGAFSRQALISLQFSTCQSAPGAPALAGGVYFTRPDSCRAARSAGRPRELRGERTGIPISLSGSALKPEPLRACRPDPK